MQAAGVNDISRAMSTLGGVRAGEVRAEAIGGAILVGKAGLQIALRDLERRLTTKVGGIMTVAVGIILAAVRFLPAVHT
jgi:hypothetical protein